MPVVLIHGVPDTTALWDPLVASLGARGTSESDIVRVALPGFAARVPEGFGCTKDEYADWIVGQLRAIGEQVMEAMSGEALVTGLRDGGHPDPEAAARLIDDTMKAAVLALYRSAVTVGEEWQPTVEGNTRPALVGWGEHDPYSSPAFGRALAERAHGEFLLLEGAGHWSIVERPDETADALVRFWAGA